MANVMGEHVFRDFSGIASTTDEALAALNGSSISEQGADSSQSGADMTSAVQSPDGITIPAVDKTKPFFTRVHVSNSGFSFADQWLPSMPTPNYIGNTEMLLCYLQSLERFHGVTMPIRACGVDPIVFENVNYTTLEEGFAKTFTISKAGWENNDGEEDEGEENAENEGTAEGADTLDGTATEDGVESDSANSDYIPAPSYELIEIDGDLFLSCVDECLDKNYLNSIIAEATSSVKATRSYIFQMVGFRKLELEEGERTARLLNTLRLNTFEMSVLVSYMQEFPNMEVTYEIVQGKQCICFRVNN